LKPGSNRLKPISALRSVKKAGFSANKSIEKCMSNIVELPVAVNAFQRPYPVEGLAGAPSGSAWLWPCRSSF
jgi:hypothetical protein